MICAALFAPKLTSPVTGLHSSPDAFIILLFIHHPDAESDSREILDELWMTRHFYRVMSHFISRSVSVSVDLSVFMCVCARRCRESSGGGGRLAWGGAAVGAGGWFGSELWWEPGHLPQRRSHMGNQVCSANPLNTSIKLLLQVCELYPIQHSEHQPSHYAVFSPNSNLAVY